MPSVEVAKNCSLTILSASNHDGKDFASAFVSVAVLYVHSVSGVRKLSELIKAISSLSFVAPILTVPLAGKSNFSDVQLSPSQSKAKAALLTSREIERSSFDFVAPAPFSDDFSSGL